MPKTIEKMKRNEESKRRRMIFYLDAPEAGEVLLLGDFNDWNLRKHPMKKADSGVWKKTAMLFPGRYEYKFLVDGQWQTDPANEQICWNRFGTQNNVIEVKAG